MIYFLRVPNDQYKNDQHYQIDATTTTTNCNNNKTTKDQPLLYSTYYRYNKNQSIHSSAAISSSSLSFISKYLIQFFDGGPSYRTMRHHHHHPFFMVVLFVMVVTSLSSSSSSPTFITNVQCFTMNERTSTYSLPYDPIQQRRNNVRISPRISCSVVRTQSTMKHSKHLLFSTTSLSFPMNDDNNHQDDMNTDNNNNDIHNIMNTNIRNEKYTRMPNQFQFMEMNHNKQSQQQSQQQKVQGQQKVQQQYHSLHTMKLEFEQYMRTNHQYKEAFQCIYEMFRTLDHDKRKQFNGYSSSSSRVTQKRDTDDNNDVKNWDRIIDTMIQTFTSRVWTVQHPMMNHNNNGKQKNHNEEPIFFLGIQAIYLQLSSSSSSTSSNWMTTATTTTDKSGGTKTPTSATTTTTLFYPYNTVPKHTLLGALNALTTFTNNNKDDILLKSRRKRKRSETFSSFGTSTVDSNSGKTPPPPPPPGDFVVMSSDRFSSSYDTIHDVASDEAFRILQRLVTGVGVRRYIPTLSKKVVMEPETMENNNIKQEVDIGLTTTGPPAIESMNNDPPPIILNEQEFNKVLNSFANIGRMDMVHRVLALQERTVHAPPLSAVSYSILWKGYGRLNDLQGVESVLQHAMKNHIEPDTIVMNTLLNAYINCNAIHQAIAVFDCITQTPSLKNRNTDTTTVSTAVLQKNIDSSSSSSSAVSSWFEQLSCPPKPNRRTYNIMLKGYANHNRFEEANELAKKMKALRLWDYITTNTLVHASVKVGSLQYANEILMNHTVTSWDHRIRKYHPNVEAYTELIDAYCRSSMDNQLNKAIAVLQRMQTMNVQPNEVTYACLLGGLGRHMKIIEAKKTIQYMNATHIRITTKSYNAFISGLVRDTTNNNVLPFMDDNTNDYPATNVIKESKEDLDTRVDEGLRMVRDMIQSHGLRPNEITVSVLVEALGRCNPPRKEEAILLIDKFFRKGFIPIGNRKVLTALVHICGKSGDVKSSMEAFQAIYQPDTVAINTFLDACCRCGRDDIAMKTFEQYFKKQYKHQNQNRQQQKILFHPDVISYSVVIGALLRESTMLSSNMSSFRKVQIKYDEMKQIHQIYPDTALIDVILKAFIRYCNLGYSIDKKCALFIANVMKDAENLQWGEGGQLDRRKRAVRDRLRDDDLWNQDWKDILLPSLQTTSSYSNSPTNNNNNNMRSSKNNIVTDTLFERKGWNQVDSGFRLWGGGRSSSSSSTRMENAKKQQNQLTSSNGDTGGNTSPTTCSFLESHGWNDVDSSFRLF